jgi:hypothetical protein
MALVGRDHGRVSVRQRGIDDPAGWGLLDGWRPDVRLFCPRCQTMYRVPVGEVHDAIGRGDSVLLFPHT